MFEAEKKLKSIDTVHSDTRITSCIGNDIVEILYFDNIEIDLKLAIIDFEIYDKLVGDKRVKKLIVSGHFTSITKEAKIYISEQNKLRENKIIAEAIVTHSIAQEILAKFYFSIANKSYSLKIFSEIRKAKDWLIGYKKS